MKEVIRLNKKEENEKPVEFLEVLLNGKWVVAYSFPDSFDYVLYRETIDGLDYFITWNKGHIAIFEYRGHLNSGKY